jgi:AraC family transcriptional regulator
VWDEGVVATMCAPGLRFTYARLAPRAGAERPTQTPRGQIGVAFTAHPRLVCEVDGSTRRVDVPPAATYLTGDGPIDWLEVHGPTEAVEIHVDADLLSAVGADRAGNAFAVDDAVVLAAASQLRAAYLASGRVDDMLASTIAHRLAVHVATRYADISFPRGRQPRLTWRELETLHELVRSRLATPLTLELLAAEVHRSVFDFVRAFKDATGLTPHRFVTMVRMHHALELLRAGGTVSTSADAVGYASRYHFRQQFRAATGTEPREIVRAIAQERSRSGAP